MLFAATFTVGLLLAQAAAPTAAPAAVPAVAPAAKPEKPEKPKLICTRETQTDTIIPRRVCRTPEQIEAQARSAEKLMRSCEGPGC